MLHYDLSCLGLFQSQVQVPFYIHQSRELVTQEILKLFYQ